MFIEFLIQNQFFSYSLEEFAQILDIPCEGACFFTDKWSLDELAYGVLTDGPYQTNSPSLDDIILSIRIDREGQLKGLRNLWRNMKNQENTSSSFQSKLQISPPSSNEPTSPQPLNPLLDNISDVPPRPLNPQLLQSHPSLDITLSLSPITPLDHIHDTSLPPSPPQSQPPIIGHPLYYNYHDYHGSTCIALTIELFS
ncbi:hypothetical protein Tco_1430990 [Tanacetum coccineum]